MKIIKLMSGYECVVSEEDAELVAVNFGKEQLIRLKTGEWINTKSIEFIGEPELVAVWSDYVLDKNQRFFMRDGQRIYLEPHHYEQIEYKPHPKYQMIKKILMEKMKMVSDKEMSKVNMEVAKEERKSK